MKEGDWTRRCKGTKANMGVRVYLELVVNIIFNTLSQLVGTRDGQTQSARAWLFFFLHLDGLKTPIYTQTIDTKEGEKTTTQTPLHPSPQTHPPKNFKI